MRQPAGLYQDAVGGVFGEHFVKHGCHFAACAATEAAAGNFTHGNAAAGEHCAVYADFAEFIDDDEPFFIRGFLRDEASDGGGFACTEKTGEQVDFGEGHGGILSCGG